MASANHALTIEGRPSGPLMTVSYWLTDTASGEWAIVDPSYQAAEAWGDRLAAAAAPTAILITHGHFDHCAGVAALLRRFPGAPVYVHPDSAEMLQDAGKNGSLWAGLPYEPATATHFYREGDTVSLGESKLRVLEAPGHCPGSVLLVCGHQLLVGDVLFQGSVGRWDLPGADYDLLAASIRDKIMPLPDATIVYPGHGPATTVGEERRSNYIVQKMMRGERY